MDQNMNGNKMERLRPSFFLLKQKTENRKQISTLAKKTTPTPTCWYD